MPTFGELKAKVSAKLLDPNHTAISALDVGDALIDSLRYWKQHRFWFNEAHATTTLTYNNPVVSGIPSDFLYELPDNGFVIEFNNLSYKLAKRKPDEYDFVSIKGIGLPYIYTWRFGRFEVYFYPNIAYTMHIYYVKDYADFSADGDENDFTTNADRLLYYEALTRLYGEQRQDDQRAAYYRGMVQQEAAGLVTRSNKNVASGRLSIESII